MFYAARTDSAPSWKPRGWVRRPPLGDPRRSVCLKCANCKAEMEAANDLMLVRRVNRSRRTKLTAAGVTTMPMFAAADLRPTSASRWTGCGLSCRTRPSF